MVHSSPGLLRVYCVKEGDDLVHLKRLPDRQELLLECAKGWAVIRVGGPTQSHGLGDVGDFT